MQEELYTLLPITFQSSDDSQIKAASDRLLELSESPEFYTVLIDIILNKETSESIKKSALIRISHEISQKWNDFPEEIQATILQSLPAILTSKTENTKQIISHFSRLVVKFSYSSGQYSNIIGDIQQSCSNPDTVLFGLMLAKSFSSIVSDKTLPTEVQISAADQLVPFLTNFLDSTDNYVCLGYILTCFYHILTNPEVKIFDENFQMFTPILVKALAISSMVDDPSYYFYAKSSTKFLIVFIDRYLPVLEQDVISPIINVSISLLSQSTTQPYVRANLLRILYQLVCREEVYEYFIHPSAQEFFEQAMYPQFSVTIDEINTAIQDPKSFVDEMHKSSNDFNDSRETAGLIIKHLAEHNQDSNEPIFNVLLQGFKEFADSNGDVESQGKFFAIAHFFSFAADSFARYQKPLLNRLVAEVSPLFEHDSELVRASAFLLISDIHCHLSVQVATACVQNCGDLSPLVRYYCQKAAANLLDKIPEQKMADEIRETVSDDVLTIMSAMLQTSNEFSDADFTNILNQIVKFFGDMLLPSAAEIAQELCTLISNSGQQPIDDEDALDNVIKINQSLATLVELVSDQGQGLETFAQQVLEYCVQALSEMTNPMAVDPFLETVGQILECCNSISPHFWQMTESLAKHFANPDFEMPVGALCEILNLLVSKDPEFHTREEIAVPLINFLLELLQRKMETPDSWNELAKVAEGILVRVPKDSPLLNEFLPQISVMIQNYIQNVDTRYHDYDGAILAMNGVLYNNFNAAQQSLGEDFPNFLENWVENPIFPETYVTVIGNFGNINADLQFIALKNLIAQTFDDILSKYVENGDDFDQDIERDGVVWFDYGETILLFFQFLQQVQGTFPDMIADIESYFDPEAWADLLRLPQIAQLYIDTRDRKLKKE
ncbi:Importin-beta N-terminal domain containing protein [Trichomonas vaginalis G3]|uniref:Importin-beta N-terminal domain containing protein n=1 Tax=Trichomonas vaginalis (strain ATCC PRA-98 / G3) TaxID=412133 RepID=A2EYL2_TRIV3|nr:armadillo (ARM) repeat-containing protein family [Trichomonas vaginalis G3]EAY02288.1 Importin-beta N-terminal domain containing protein [Trichomonas vaginalis G3]KAI5522876.1 armadillo (ARM) repeat-containing protein family [Trichomonas vaginalis G3]|eukprot:XP_001330613.1 Importin-beta N-terminal domain containing protein [Trichomonas vaginalis G3]